MGDFNANLLNIGNKFEISEFNDASGLSSKISTAI